MYVKRGDDSEGEEVEEYYSEESPYSSEYSSTNDVSDQSRVMAAAPQGLRPGPQVILAKSLPDLLMLSPTEPTELDKSCSKFLERPMENRDDPTSSVAATGRRVSMDSYGYHVRRKESLQRTLSAADSKASTLVASLPVSSHCLWFFVWRPFTRNWLPIGNVDVKPH